MAMFLDALPDRYTSARSAMEINSVKSHEGTTFKVMCQTLLAEDERQANRVENSSGYAGSATKTCKHNRTIDEKNPCWDWHPHLHPRNRVCVDCKETGHRSRLSYRFKHKDSSSAATEFGGLWGIIYINEGTTPRYSSVKSF